jgi:hypothetical protein
MEQRSQELHLGGDSRRVDEPLLARVRPMRFREAPAAGRGRRVTADVRFIMATPMSTPLFTQTVIAVVWDFDSTLIPGYMQRPLFEHYGLDEATFWAEANGLMARYMEEGGARRASKVQYLNYILSGCRQGRLPGFSNALLRRFGAQLEFFPGMPALMASLKQKIVSRPEYAAHDIRLEHYVVSTGLGEIIRGSEVAEHVDDIWGCELAFLSKGDDMSGQIALDDGCPLVAYEIDDTSKTRALFEINKGTNKHPAIDLNSVVPPDHRRIPFEHMIYIADGPSDVPAYSIVKKHGGQDVRSLRPHV